MVEKKYQKYTVEDFTQDPKFINWVKKGAEQKNWKFLLDKNPNLTKDIETARKIVEAFRMSEIEVGEDEIHSVWKNIELFYNLHHKTRKKIQFRKITRYAAMVAFLLAFGTVVSYLFFQKNNSQFTEIEVPFSNSNEAKLILSGGE